MDVAAVIVEQLDANGTLRTFRMQAEQGEHLIVAFADEYEEPRSGPFHFLDDRHESAFQSTFAECKSRRVSGTRFRSNGGLFTFLTAWSGIPTERQRHSYYALCLPEHAIPLRVRFQDPRSGREYKKSIVRDDQRMRFVLYLECRSSFGTFDFSLDVDFRISIEEFTSVDFHDDTTSPYGANIDAYQYVLPRDDQMMVQQFFAKEITMGDQYSVTGQVGAIGPNAKAENNVFNQAWQQAASDIDMKALASELAALRTSMLQRSTEYEHDLAVASIVAAERAVKAQKGAEAIGFLKSAGKWAFDVATTIGASVAAQAIQTAMGL